MIDKNSVVYSLMTDRFDNDEGNLANVRHRSDYLNLLSGYIGGTFNGIRRRIPHLETLGVTHLMISPVEECMPGDYHGYSTTRPFVINDHFGTAKDLRQLNRALLQKGICPILDYMPLTISNESDLFKEKSQSSQGREWFFFPETMRMPQYVEEAQRLVAKQKFMGENYLHFFMSPTFPFFNLKHPEVLDWHIHRASRLVNEYGFSDVRLDIGFYMDEQIIHTLREGIHSYTSNTVGVYVENWPDPFDEFNGGEFYGIADGEFNLKGTHLLNQFSKQKDLSTLIAHFYRTKGKSDMGYTFMTGIDNHDSPRFQGDFEDQKAAATLQCTLPVFTPVIYYGNETGMTDEGDDPRAVGRGVMDFNYGPYFDFYKQLLAFRKQYDFHGATLAFPTHLNDFTNLKHIDYTVHFNDGRSMRVSL